ncbi:SAGA-associated factor 11 [Madurella mycetomatis]|uniref:SAGA-associated factor 11 n=1 Tax=Madurella mycetomatis TaxID=100816 RepID=A0A175W9E5_9PEZI|nr:SAGA-associated factor 11 [Madurella mycetomatis]
MSDITEVTGKAGVIVAPADAHPMDKLAHGVLDDLLYNIVHDLLIKVHQDEKVARANTAAIKVEKLAMNTLEVETDAAIYKDGKITLKGNPLKTTKEILCPRCHLPRLLHPTDGKGAKKPDPGVIYCKKHPYIDKPGYDIYGQTWVAPGPGRGKKKKDMEKKLDPNDPSSPAPGTEGSAKDRPPNVLSFPSATCSKCKRCILVTRLNNHMGSCIGNSGRNASRAAAQKISNGSNAGSQNNDNTPPGSQKGTPLPGSRAGSPRKRDGDEFDEDADESDPTNPKKKLKPTALNKKVILKAKSPAATIKKDKPKGSSMLNVEQKVDDDDAKSSTVQVAPKKATPKGPSPTKKIKLGPAKPPLPSPAGKKAKRDRDMESESSGTLSSPPR